MGYNKQCFLVSKIPGLRFWQPPSCIPLSLKLCLQVTLALHGSKLPADASGICAVDGKDCSGNESAEKV